MIEALIKKHRSRAILLDANVLLLDVIGGVDREMIPRFKRTRKFEIEDYDLLQRLLRLFSGIVTTPNILTEVGNLGSQLTDPALSAFRRILRERTRVLDERYLASKLVSDHHLFDRMGLSDAGIAMLAEEGWLILTEDWPLASRLQTAGLDVINFTNLRTMAWTWPRNQ